MAEHAPSEPQPSHPAGGPAVSSGAHPMVGQKHNLQKFLVPAVIATDFLAICFSLVAITDREIEDSSWCYYLALIFYGLTHTIYIVNSFLEDSNTSNIPVRLFRSESFQLLTFVVIFWFSYPWMWPALFILLLPAVFQIIESVPHLGTALNVPIPPAVSQILEKLKPHRPVILNHLAILEPLLVIYLFLIIYWNNVLSIVPYFLWVCVRYEYSPYTKFAIDMLDGHIEKAIASQDAIKPHYTKAKQYLSMIGKNLPK